LVTIPTPVLPVLEKVTADLRDEDVPVLYGWVREATNV